MEVIDMEVDYVESVAPYLLNQFVEHYELVRKLIDAT
jgi:hypothetical protein